MPLTHFFHKEELIRILSAVVNKTLGEVDVKHVFDRTIENPKITGIAGDVIEQSVLGYPANSDKNPDLDVDGVKTELKTTGVRKDDKGQYSAKEPMSITAVSPRTIINEEFLTSDFYAKAAHTLFVYYLYASKETVPASEYRHFPIKGYEFHDFDDEDMAVLEKDWTVVRDFIISLQHLEDPSVMYPEISHLRNKMLYMDTAPKWPHNPRFRFKRSFVDSIVKEFFGGKEESLENVSAYSDIDRICHEFTAKYQGKPLQEIAAVYGIEPKGKSTSEQVIVSMFGAKSKKLTGIDLFSKAGILSKTITLTKTGGRTEDMKLMRVYFDEIENKDISFEDSSFYAYFAEHQFLSIILKEPYDNAPLGENLFQGFKRFSFDDDFIYSSVKKAWDNTRDLVQNKKLVDVIEYKDGMPIINKTGVVRSAPNFIKSKDNEVFFRGDSSDSTRKPEIVNGIKMYNQYIWIKGKYIAEKISAISYL